MKTANKADTRYPSLGLLAIPAFPVLLKYCQIPAECNLTPVSLIEKIVCVLLFGKYSQWLSMKLYEECSRVRDIHATGPFDLQKSWYV